MTIREAHKAWGGKADHLLTYHRTMNVFDKGFESLDLCRHINHYGIKDFAEALRKSGLNYANMHMAASVMCKVLEEYGTIDFTAEDLLDYKEEGKDQPATPPVMEESPECPPSVEQPRDTTAGKNSKTQKLTNSKVVKKKGITKPKPVNQIDPKSGLVFATYESVCAAERAVGVKNIRRAIEIKGKAGGYLWEYATPEEANRKPEPEPESKNNETMNVENILSVLEIDEKQFYRDDGIFLNRELAEKLNEKLCPLLDPVYELTPEARRLLELAECTNQELVNEMRKRGWRGDIEVVEKISL